MNYSHKRLISNPWTSKITLVTNQIERKKSINITEKLTDMNEKIIYYVTTLNDSKKGATRISANFYTSSPQ